MVNETLLSYYLLLMPSSRTAVHFQPSTPSSVGQLNSWMDFYGIPVPKIRVKRLVNFLGGSS